MKKKHVIKLGIAITLLFSATHGWTQEAENWTPKQLIEPATLVSELDSTQDAPVIISVGPAALIQNSIAAGMASTTEGIAKLKELLQTVPKEKKVVIYCGCCPFAHCPNVRPAITMLKEMKFTNYYLLDLPHNIKQDWIDKGYPAAKM
jgi:thiosulfate/3-mercaptopyruvate sulfurtransferase